MAQDKRQLQQLLDFIDELVKPENGNEWFLKALQERFGGTKNTDDSRSGDGQMNIIKKYMSLDFLSGNKEINWQVSDLFDFVTDDYVRKELYTNWNEMLRHRFANKIDFEQSCRRASIVSELLINHYFFIKSGSDENVGINYIESLNPKPLTGKEFKQRIDDVPLKYKLFSFSQYMKNNSKIIGYYDYLEKIATIRNKESHGQRKNPLLEMDKKCQIFLNNSDFDTMFNAIYAFTSDIKADLLQNKK